MSLRRLWLIATKETWHILRDFRTVYMALGIPVVMLLLFGYALTMDVEDIPLLVIDQDHSQASRELGLAFVTSGIFSVVAQAEDAHDLVARFERNQVKAALIIPPDFERDLAHGDLVHAQLIVDGTDANVASIALGYAAAIAQSRTLALVATSLERHGLPLGKQLRPPVTVKTRQWFNPTLRSQWYMVPGLIAVIMAMMAVLLMALTVAREWERGTMEQLLVTPVHPTEIVLGKLVPYFVIGLGQLALVAGAGVLLFDLPMRGSGVLLVAISSLFLIGSLGQGLLISIATRQQQLAMQFALLSSILPGLLLSGFMAPIASMPKFVQWISVIVPARYFLVVTRGIFLKGLGLAALWPQALALAVFAVVMLALGVARFRTRLE